MPCCKHCSVLVIGFGLWREPPRPPLNYFENPVNMSSTVVALQAVGTSSSDHTGWGGWVVVGGGVAGTLIKVFTLKVKISVRRWDKQRRKVCVEHHKLQLIKFWFQGFCISI